ncbi:hypothetical protein [Rhodococcus sp. ENV425]|uniref:hypothetical protein n=1 Tax=Rhodococcus sp. ENV425 TaxID=2042960 RepID=UPI000C9D0920|nr:hypothetical protein [Rhodococcus sp. ENV425]PND52924.1 hypothetical protein CQZ88_06215 [Rhodococcus sp. ENV425]
MTLLHDLLMIVMRVGWILLAVVTVFLGIAAATSSMLEITDCEIGVYSREVPGLAACNASIWSYFGGTVVPALAVPVAVCLIPVLKPRQSVSWLAVAALFALSVVGFFAAFTSSTPTWVGLYGFFWPLLPLALLIAGVASLAKPRPSGSTRDSLQYG